MIVTGKALKVAYNRNDAAYVSLRQACSWRSAYQIARRHGGSKLLQDIYRDLMRQYACNCVDSARNYLKTHSLT